MLKEIETPNQFFLDDPKLSLQGLADADLQSLFAHGRLIDRPEAKWYGVFDAENMFAVLRLEPYINNSVITHVYISTPYQQRSLLKYIFIDTVAYLKKHTQYSSVTVPIPAPCKHVIRVMEPLGFHYAGRLRKKLIWRDKKVDLLYYKRDI